MNIFNCTFEVNFNQDWTIQLSTLVKFNQKVDQIWFNNEHLCLVNHLKHGMKTFFNVGNKLKFICFNRDYFVFTNLFLFDTHLIGNLLKSDFNPKPIITGSIPEVHYYHLNSSLFSEYLNISMLYDYSF